MVYRGVEPLEELGWSMNGCDLDQDGDEEIIVGAPGMAECTHQAGRVFVVDGAPFGTR